MLMIPALGFFEAGLIRSKNSLSTLMQTFSGLIILSVLWFVIGFTLVYAPSPWGIIGGLNWTFFNGVPINKSLDYAPTIPGVTFATYQMMFAVITPLLITGAFAERLKWECFFRVYYCMEYFHLLSASTLGVGKRLACTARRF